MAEMITNKTKRAVMLGKVQLGAGASVILEDDAMHVMKRPSVKQYLAHGEIVIGDGNKAKKNAKSGSDKPKSVIGSDKVTEADEGS